jgi:imidazolonepropionase-like amidohydrolase
MRPSRISWCRARSFLFVLPCVLGPTAANAAPMPSSPEPKPTPMGVLLREVCIVDPAAGVTRPPTDVLVLGDRIVAIGRGMDAGAVPVVEGNGRFLMPGLIDTHVHLSSLPDAMRDVALRRTLEGGVTRVRDMGGHGPMLVDLRARSKRAIDDRDQADARPAVYCVAVVAGSTWMAADARAAASAGEGAPGTQPWLAAIDDPGRAAGIADAAAAFGVDGLKLYADMDAEVVEALSAEARERGLAVWSHATIFPAKPDAVVAAGVQAVSHAEMLFFAADASVPARYHAAAFGGREAEDAKHPAVLDALDQMAAAGTMLEPTLTVTEVRRSRGLVNAAHVAATHAIVREAERRGVPILAGTDLMITPGTDGPNIHLELELLVEGAGLSPAAALRGATTHAATILGREGELGVVAAGAIADLVLLERDPLENIGATRSIAMVIRGGLVIEPTPVDHGDAGANGEHWRGGGSPGATAGRRVAAMSWFGGHQHAGRHRPGTPFSRYFDDPFCVCADVLPGRSSAR